MGSVGFYVGKMYRHMFRVIRVSDSIHHYTGDNLEHIMYGPRHGWTSFGFGPSVL